MRIEGDDRGQLARPLAVFLFRTEHLLRVEHIDLTAPAGTGEVGTVDLVEPEAGGEGTGLQALVQRFQVVGATVQTGAELAGDQAQAQFTVAVELAADIDPSQGREHVVSTDAPVIVIEIGAALGDGQMRGDKKRVAGTQWLIPLALPTGGLADLHIVAPLGTALVEPGLAIAAEQVEGRIAIEIAGKSQAEAQVVRSPGLFGGIDGQHALAILFQHPVADMLEIAGAIKTAHVLVEHRLVNGLAGLRVDQADQGLRVDPLEILEANFIDH